MKPTLPKPIIPELEELARQQGVRPVPHLEEWLAQLPPDDTDTEDLLPTLTQLRRELRRQEAQP
jgi:hypothetical protein